jgi:radical SAM superfamily enzyme YgiQ (UPF0313 family)
MDPLRVALVSTYDLGRQPFGLASPAAWLRSAGMEVTCLDLSLQRLDESAIDLSDLVAFYLPMHTAARTAARVAARVRELNPDVHLCFYGLYAAMNEPYLRRLGAQTILGGEFEEGLVSLSKRLQERKQGGTYGDGLSAPEQIEPVISLARQRFIDPDRSGLPPLASYARLDPGDGRMRVVGSTEASRGCQHLCRHCPVVPVYRGTFRIVQREIVLEDIRRQVAAGAEHVTFGDPDFFNGPGHAMAIVRALHREHPRLTYDATIRIEHLLRYARHVPVLRETGCLFVTSAVESIDDRVLALLEKGHTRDDFVRAARLCRDAGLAFNPTFVAFTPWITCEGYLELLSLLARLHLVESVAPVQLTMRLLIPAGSRLLELPEVRSIVGPLDETALVHPWRHPDPRVDRLQQEVQSLVREAAARGASRWEIFLGVWDRAARLDPSTARSLLPDTGGPRHAPIPYLTEPWYC